MCAIYCIVFSTRCTFSQALAIFHITFWLMSIGEDSNLELGLKDIGYSWTLETGRAADSSRRRLSRQKENDSQFRLLPERRYIYTYVAKYICLHNARINGMPHLPPSAPPV